jgi:hypothetical protein
MRNSLIGFCFGGLVVAASATPTQAETITGMLGVVQCGDRCYLMIVDAAGKSRWGWCVASECQRWLSDHQRALSFLGKTARVKTRPGYGQVIDEGGHPAPDLLLFIDIFFPPS